VKENNRTRAWRGEVPAPATIAAIEYCRALEYLLRELPSGAEAKGQRARLVGRLEHLAEMKLVEPVERGIWAVSPDAERTLRTMGEQDDIIRTMQRALTRERREYAIFNARESAWPVTGAIVAKGLRDELLDHCYLIVDGTDGRAHHVTVATKVDLTDLPVGAIVTVRSAGEPRAADRTIAALASDGFYRTAHHVEIARGDTKRSHDPEASVGATCDGLRRFDGAALSNGWRKESGVCRLIWLSGARRTTCSVQTAPWSKSTPSPRSTSRAAPSAPPGLIGNSSTEHKTLRRTALAPPRDRRSPSAKQSWSSKSLPNAEAIA
jgi:hypothetical protein